jgi:hypothetical protein
MRIWNITPEPSKHPSGGIRCIRPEMKPQHTSSRCPKSLVTRVLGTAAVVMFEISWSSMGAFYVVYNLTNHLHLDLGHYS